MKSVMKRIKENSFKIDEDILLNLQNIFTSESLNEIEILNTIKDFYKKYKIIIDPHTAIGVGAIKKLKLNDVVVLATAHPSKFPKATEKAIAKTENLPNSLDYIYDKEEKFKVISNDLDKVKSYVTNSL